MVKQRFAGMIVLLVLMATMVLPVSADAASVDLSIKDVQPIQVIQGAPLVLGKATVVRVTVGVTNVNVDNANAIPARITLTFAGKTYRQDVSLDAGQTTQTVDIFPDPPAQLQPVQANAKIDAGTGWTDSNPGNNTLAQPVTLDVVQTKDNAIHLVFLPVDWSDQDFQKFTDSTGSYKKNFDTFLKGYAADNAEYLASTFPVIDSKVVYTYTTVPHNLTAAERAGFGGGLLNSDFFTLLATAMFAGRQYDPEATVVIALMPPGWFAKRGERGTMGVTSLNFKGVTLNEVILGTPSTDVPAHETGHQYGLDEDYNFRDRKNPRIGYPIDVPGYWVAEKIPVPVVSDRAKQVLGFMAGGDGRKTNRDGVYRWADSPTYWWLLGKFAASWTGQPSIAPATAARELDRTGKYYVSAATFTSGDDKVVYLSVPGRYLKEGQQVTVKWYRNNQLVLDDKPETITESLAFQYVDFSLYNKNGLQSGNYRADIFLDGKKAQSTNFTVK